MGENDSLNLVIKDLDKNSYTCRHKHTYMTNHAATHVVTITCLISYRPLRGLSSETDLFHEEI